MKKIMSTKEMSELTGLSSNTLKTFARTNQIKKVSIRRTPANQIEYLYDFCNFEEYARAKGWTPEDETLKFDEPQIIYEKPQPFTKDEPKEEPEPPSNDSKFNGDPAGMIHYDPEPRNYRTEYLTLELLSAFREIFGDLGTRNILINNYGLTPETEI